MKNLIKKILLAIANFIIRIIAFMVLPSTCEDLAPDKIKSILIYGQMGIGNMILFTPFLKALRNYFPDTRIVVLLLRKNGAEQVLEGSNLADEIVIWNYQDLTYRQRLQAIISMKNRKPDLIVSRFASYPIDCALTTILSRAPYRVGHVSSGGWKGIYDYLHNYKVKMKDNEHEIDRYLHLAKDIGISVIDKTPVFPILEDDEQAALTFLRTYDIKKDDQFVTIQIGTNPVQSWKRWDTEKWSALAVYIIENNIRMVVVGSSDERDLIDETFSSLTNKPINAAGELTLKQTAVVIKRSSLLVCNDSGLMHVAVAVDTPTVAIYGPTDYTRTAPLGKKHVVIRKDLPCSPCLTMKGPSDVEACQNRICLDSITVEEVLEAIDCQLNLKSTNKTHIVEGSTI